MTDPRHPSHPASTGTDYWSAYRQHFYGQQQQQRQGLGGGSGAAGAGAGLQTGAYTPNQPGFNSGNLSAGAGPTGTTTAATATSNTDRLAHHYRPAYSYQGYLGYSDQHSYPPAYPNFDTSYLQGPPSTSLRSPPALPPAPAYASALPSFPHYYPPYAYTQSFPYSSSGLPPLQEDSRVSDASIDYYEQPRCSWHDFENEWRHFIINDEADLAAKARSGVVPGYQPQRMTAVLPTFDDYEVDSTSGLLRHFTLC